jgi:hypothetical protein
MKHFNHLPNRTSHAGNDRTVGLEFEMANIKPEAIADGVISVFGGKVSTTNSLVLRIATENDSDFIVEFDTQFFQRLHESSHKDSVKGLKHTSLDIMTKLAEQVIPYELVTPPLALQDLGKVQQVVDYLHQHNAQGTKSSFVHAFGMHLNIDIASDEASHLTRIMRAFLICYPWLKHVMQVDMTRRMLTFIDPFPQSYTKLVINPEYSPTQAAFISDYIRYNPTRNRALDLTSLIAYLDESAIEITKFLFLPAFP